MLREDVAQVAHIQPRLPRSFPTKGTVPAAHEALHARIRSSADPLFQQSPACACPSLDPLPLGSANTEEQFRTELAGQSNGRSFRGTDRYLSPNPTYFCASLSFGPREIWSKGQPPEHEDSEGPCALLRRSLDSNKRVVHINV